MKNEILIGLGGLVLSILTYFAGVRRTENRYLDVDRKQRIDAVFKTYMEFRREIKTAGHDGLLKAGVATLESNEEILELAEKIIAHGELDPLERKSGLLDSVNLKKLFDYAAKNRINFLRTKLEEIIEKSEA